VTRLLESLALTCTAAGLVAGLLVLARTGKGLPALRVALDFWVAAGLLRLAGPPSWPALAGAAAVVALRQLLGLGLRASAATGAGSVLAGLVVRPARRPRHHPPGD
jgi:hypothetical protein